MKTLCYLLTLLLTTASINLSAMNASNEEPHHQTSIDSGECYSTILSIASNLLLEEIKLDLQRPILYTSFAMCLQKIHPTILTSMLQDEEYIATLQDVYNNVEYEKRLSHLARYLGLACEHGHSSVVQTIFALAGPGNHSKIYELCTRNNLTPLHIAASKGHTDIVKLIFHPIYKLNAYQLCGLRSGFCRNTPLHVAVSTGHTDIVRLMLEASETLAHIPCFKENSHGYNPLIEAICRGHTDIVKLILDACKRHANKLCSQNDKDGWTALHYAALKGRTEIARLILAYVTNITELCLAKNRDGRTALDIAKEKGHTEIVALLEEYDNYYGP